MVNIEYIEGQNTFKINNVTLVRNFHSYVSGTKIRVVNAYDTTDVLLPYTLFSEISVNGVVYNSAIELAEILSPILFLKQGGSGTGTGGVTSYSGNIITKTVAVAIDWTLDPDAQIVAFVNAQEFLVYSTQRILFKAVRITGDLSTSNSSETYFWEFKPGKGSYGVNGTQITINDIEYISYVTNYQNNVIDLGEIGSTPIEIFVNDSGPYALNSSLLNIFKATRSTTPVNYIYIGSSNNIGSGAAQTVSSEYLDVNAEPVNPPSSTDGKSAYEIAVDFGFVGTEEEWLASLVGTPGGANVNGEYINNSAALAAGLQIGDIYRLPYLKPGSFYPLAIVGETPILNRKSLTVSSASSQTDYPVYLNVYNTAGTDTPNNIYLDGKVRSDWGDVRILKADFASIPFGIVRKEATYITLVFSASLINGDSTFYIDYNKTVSANNLIKIGVTTDQHYDPAQTFVGRDQALVKLDNFKTEMAAYLPDIILEGGDKTGATTANATSLLGFMQSVTDKHSEIAATLGKPHYLWGWGNHDFEKNSFASVQAQYNGLLGQVSGKLYASWEDANFRYISLDSNYKPADDTHHSVTHVGYGYIDAPQLTWLTSVLNAATKPCIVLCHHSLAEFDTARVGEDFGLSKEIYHVQNRAAVRDILEANNKVAFVLQGHVHEFMHNSINGITYIGLTNLNEPPSQYHNWKTPNANLSGKWSKIEIDKDALTVRVIEEAVVNSVVTTVYDVKIPYKTVFETEYGDNPEAVFASGNLALYEKPSIVTDASDLYVNDSNFVVVKPANIFDADPILTSKTLKIIGLTSSPDWGRVYYDYAAQTGKFSVKFRGRVNAIQNKLFKIMNKPTLIAAYVGFRENGSITAYNSTSDNLLMTYNINTWYEFEFIIDPTTGKYDVIIDDVLKASQYSFYAAGATTLNYMEILSSIGNGFIDSFRIEKYVSPEPSIAAFGSEQTIEL